jgi:peptidoglycan/xylan/chitin deacetylase (PgdA/CDA1 family)
VIAAALLLALAALGIGAPYLVLKRLGWSVARRGDAGAAAIGLSFDDGPDPEMTPVVLDLLARHGVQATFFVVGVAAERHPDLVRRALADGHEVGSHGWRHRHALFQRWPLEGWFDTVRGVRRLAALIDRPVRLYRGPWGAYSWSSRLAARRMRVAPVNWSIEAHDWHPRFAPRDVVRKVLDEASAGAIIVMHDAGRGGNKTVHALDELLHGLRARGLEPVPVSRLRGLAAEGAGAP